MSQALVKVDVNTLQPAKSIEELKVTLARLQASDVNILSPVASVDHIKALHAVSLRAVVIDPTITDPKNGQGPECYRGKFCQGDEVALGGVAINKLMAAAGAQVISKRRLDDRGDANYCEIEVYVGVRDFDGTPRQAVGTKEIDLRDGSAAAQEGTRTGMLGFYRQHIQSTCETKAIYRALRKLFALRQKYSAKELGRPWIVPKLVVTWDMTDPDQKRAAIDEARLGERALYGAVVPVEDEPRLLKDVTPARELEAGSNGTAPAAAATTPVAPKPAAVEASPDDFELLEPPAAPIVCTCPCGDQHEVSPEVAKLTTDAVGAIRCRACFPGRGFDYNAHKDIKSLNLPKKPNLTAAMIRDAVKTAAAGGR